MLHRSSPPHHHLSSASLWIFSCPLRPPLCVSVSVSLSLGGDAGVPPQVESCPLLSLVAASLLTLAGLRLRSAAHSTDASLPCCAACILQRFWIWVKSLWLRIPNPTLMWDTRETPERQTSGGSACVLVNNCRTFYWGETISYSECLQVKTLALHSPPWRPTKGMRNLSVAALHLCRIFCCCLLHFLRFRASRSRAAGNILCFVFLLFSFCFFCFFFNFLLI